MPRLYYFNPDNDVALASGVECYTPPRAALRLREAGRMLPLWIGEAGDMVMCPGVNRDWYHGVIDAFGLETRVFDHAYRPDLRPTPWGWSAAMRRFFVNDGCPLELLPAPADIERMRQLSHRRTSAELAAALRRAMPGARLTQPAVEAFSMEQVEELTRSLGRVVVKMPWSSSGRGVFGTSRSVAEAMKIAANALRLQGSVMVEPEHDRALDFAKIYRCQGGLCQCLGTSVFATDAHHRYMGNLLAPEADRRAVVARCTDIATVDEAAEALRRLIEERIAPYYDGVLGVDMLACADGTLDPVVELNLRCTMGHVANTIADRYLAPGSTGRFEVLPMRGEQQQPGDAVIEDRRLVRGTYCLTPSLRDFCFRISVTDAAGD